ncbi:hypothetical protein DFH11DRAFT_1574347, partial [Phellopilus nigrolimitatus]
MGIWGVGAGTAALLLLSVTPIVKREFLVKVPVVRNISYSLVIAANVLVTYSRQLSSLVLSARH